MSFDLDLKGKVFAAPMAGVSDLPYRKILKSFGAALLFTEMVSAKALCYKDKKTYRLTNIEDIEGPVGVQIFGSEPEIMAEGARIVQAQTKARFIDINMGCPVPKIVGNGEGSALLKNPALIAEIVTAVKKAVSIPVTVKIRAGFSPDTINAVEVAKILEASGCDMVSVHGRTREQYYSGKADWNIIREVKNSVKIPVCGNGDIFSGKDAVDMLESTGCDYVMPARGLMGNPWLIKECNCAIDGTVYTPPSVEERLDMALYHAAKLAEYAGERNGIRQARAHLSWYVKGLRGASRLKNALTAACTVAEVESILKGGNEE
ncbi:MAG: tRNA dihydrouridine synthase DusB [Clostridia bacterium]|nr:tRNA dihydrouridine synthase DusB [Clostridia bacterium]